MDWNSFGIITTLIFTILGTTYGQFLSLRTLISKVKDEILAKLEYHERHDDSRFANIRNDITDIRVRNAARDGVPSLPRYREPELLNER